MASRFDPRNQSEGRQAHQEGLADGDAAVEECLPWPDALEDAAVVAQHGVEDPEALAGREHPLGHDTADARHFLPDLRLHQGRDARRVHIAMGEMPQQVARGPDSESRELLGAALADSLEELDGRIQARGGHSTSGSAGVR